MALTIDELKELIQIDEHRQLELKKTTGELKDGMHTACSFLNTARIKESGDGFLIH